MSLQEYLEREIEAAITISKKDSLIKTTFRHYAEAWLEILGEFTESEKYDGYKSQIAELKLYQ